MKQARSWLLLLFGTVAASACSDESRDLLHWNGERWAPRSTGELVLYAGIWGSRPDNYWAVGQEGAALHFDGRGWSKVPSATTSNLAEVSGSCAENVWAVGAAGTIVHWDGSEWKSSESGTDKDLYGVWAVSDEEAWAVGQAGTLLRWLGTRWAPQPIEIDSDLIAVYGRAPDDVWAVGSESWVIHWNGEEWSKQKVVLADAGARFHDVWSSSANDVWIATSAGVIRGNGQSWSRVLDAPLTASIWGATDREVWAVGVHSSVQKWDGTKWEIISTNLNADEAFGQFLVAIWGTGPNDVWAGGQMHDTP
jgi:hypothetical protein